MAETPSRVKRLRLLEEFNRYMRAVYHLVPLGPDDWRDRHMVFYGGACAALSILMRDRATGNESPEADLEAFIDLKEELLAHAKAMRPPIHWHTD
ncbi:MAG: hypothetical protein LAP40_23525 [Acidobacteriia bacterium]|nr:hypothetical protein [Terriglobia bacterium]